MEETIAKLKKWVEENYDPCVCDYTYRRSEGNFYDCFIDGETSVTSWAAYEVGKILGMDLEEPAEAEDDGENNEY